MDLIHTGGGYLGDLITVAALAFLVLLAAFIALNIFIACRYHSRRHTYTAKTRRQHGRGTGSAASRTGHCGLPQPATADRPHPAARW